MTTRREFLLLADTYKADKHDPIGMMMSEKLDGNRCFWDGGVSRGDDTVNVPWASVTDPKTGEPKSKVKPKATGLWSRYGNPVMAPDWFLDALPPEPLDGELYIDRGCFQQTQSIVRKDVPDEEAWREVSFVAFGAPTLGTVFQRGLIKNANFLQEIHTDECMWYVQSRGFGWGLDQRTFTEELDVLDELLVRYADGGVFNTVDQTVCESFMQLNDELKRVKDLGGEGLMLRDPDSVWFPKRRPFLLKVKPRHDAEATIVGFVAGKKGKTGQFLGKLGTLQCVWNGDPTAPCGLLKKGVTFEIGTGLTHEDRELHDVDVPNAKAHPGKPLSGLVSCTPHFQIGDRVTFSYMDVSNDNVPREPSYIRKRED